MMELYPTKVGFQMYISQEMAKCKQRINYVVNSLANRVFVTVMVESIKLDFTSCIINFK